VAHQPVVLILRCEIDWSSSMLLVFSDPRSSQR
jgi:hypothetical protein